MIQVIALFIFLILCVFAFYKMKWNYHSGKTVHWNENFTIEETYSALEYDRHGDYRPI